MKLLKQFFDSKGYLRERTIETLKNNTELKEGDLVSVADTGYFYNIVSLETDIPLQNNLFAEIKETSFLRKLLQHIEKLVNHSDHGHMSNLDKIKIDGIETNANNYTHPTDSGNIHLPAGGVQGQILKNSSNGRAQWTDTVPVLKISNNFYIKGYEIGIEE